MEASRTDTFFSDCLPTPGHHSNSPLLTRGVQERQAFLWLIAGEKLVWQNLGHLLGVATSAQALGLTPVGVRVRLVCVCMCVHARVCLCLYALLCLRVYVCVHVCACACVRSSVHACVFKCVHV